MELALEAKGQRTKRQTLDRTIRRPKHGKPEERAPQEWVQQLSSQREKRGFRPGQHRLGLGRPG